MGESLELVSGDDDCVEPCGQELKKSEMLDQSNPCKRSEGLAEWDDAEEVDSSGGGPTAIGNCNREVRSSNEHNSVDERDVIFGSYPRSGGSRS